MSISKKARVYLYEKGMGPKDATRKAGIPFAAFNAMLNGHHHQSA